MFPVWDFIIRFREFRLMEWKPVVDAYLPAPLRLESELYEWGLVFASYFLVVLLFGLTIAMDHARKIQPTSLYIVMNAIAAAPMLGVLFVIMPFWFLAVFGGRAPYSFSDQRNHSQSTSNSTSPMPASEPIRVSPDSPGGTASGP
jgi:hypothetical protein